MRLNTIEFPADMFTVTGHQISAESSDMGNRHLQRLYDDAADVGFAMRLPVGEVITFSLVDVKKDGEGELMYWIYAATADSIRRIPECRKIQAIVFND
jgi:hypothetical protein